MIRKISIQDVVSKHKDNESNSSDSNRRERDFLIERLHRKHPVSSIAESPVKVTKHSSKKNKGSGIFGNLKFGKKWIWFGIPFILIFIFFVILQFMFSAIVTVKPKQSTVPVDTKIAASLTATTSPNTIMYQVITLSSVDKESVLATGTVAVKPQKASGQITIFNNYSSAPQELVKNTRFETTDGLIYRIKNTISVPGIISSGGKTLPGSLTVTVVADQVGSKYNIDLSDFTIPGFKTNTGRYEKIFARSKTVMTGGKDANSFGISDADRQAAENDIEARLQDNLLHQVQSQKTADSVIFDSASKISFQHLPDTVGVDTNHVNINEQGTISSVVFDKVAIGKLLFSDAIAEVGGNAEISGIENLHFIAAVSSTSPIWQSKPFDFTLTGSVNVVGVVDTNKLLQDIVGIPRSDLTKVLSNYPTVDKASAVVKPFWKSSFPTNPSDIKINVVEDNTK